MSNINITTPELTEKDRESFKHLIKLQERHQFFLKSAETKPSWRPSEKPLEFKINGCTNLNGQGVFGINFNFYVKIKELYYPGSDTDYREIKNKWIYIFKDKKLHVEIHADPEQKGWRIFGSNLSISVRGIVREPGGIELDPGDKDNPNTYYFFLSPIRLSTSAVDYLIENQNYIRASITADFNRYNNKVFLVDPVFWASETNHRFYSKTAAKYASELSSEKTGAKLFITNTIRQWLEGDRFKPYDFDFNNESLDVIYARIDEIVKPLEDHDDPYNVDNKLNEGEPYASLRNHYKDVARLKEAMEKSAAYLAHCIDSHEFFAVEKSAMEGGDEDLCIFVQGLAASLMNIGRSTVGCTLGNRLLANKDRFPSKYIFTETPDKFDFQQKHLRWGWIALISIYEDLLPLASNVEKFAHKSARFLDNIGMDKSVIKPVRALTGNKYFRFDFNKKYKKSGFKHFLRTTQKTHADYKIPVRLMNAGFGMALEITNLVTAVKEYRKADNQHKFIKGLSVASAASDTMALAFAIMSNAPRDDSLKITLKNLTLSTGKKVVLSGAAAGFSMVSSVMDMVVYAEDADAAIAVHDYWAARGHQMKMYGALSTGVASSMALASLIMSGSIVGGPLTAIFGAAGAVLIIAGSLVVEFMKLTPHKKFTYLCFMGTSLTEKLEPANIFWSNIQLPVKRIGYDPDYITESKALLQLIANFKVELSQNTLSIYPGLYYENSVFYMELEFGLAEKEKSIDVKDCHPDYIFDESNISDTRYAKLLFDFSSHALEQTNIDDENVYWLYTSPQVYGTENQIAKNTEHRTNKIDIDLTEAIHLRAANTQEKSFSDLGVVKITANVYLELDGKKVYIPKKLEKDNEPEALQALQLVWSIYNIKTTEFSLNKEKFIKIS